MRRRLRDVEVRAVIDSGLEPESIDEAAAIVADLRAEIEQDEFEAALRAGDQDAWRKVKRWEGG